MLPLPRVGIPGWRGEAALAVALAVDELPIVQRTVGVLLRAEPIGMVAREWPRVDVAVRVLLTALPVA